MSLKNCNTGFACHAQSDPENENKTKYNISRIQDNPDIEKEERVKTVERKKEIKSKCWLLLHCNFAVVAAV